jgi:phosphoribosylformimino-5-aminoimidazole carboxamide ribotide isomerase
MPEFTIYPAIDLRRGQVVRLQEGDPNRQTHYGSDPAAVARRWLSAGARWLHVVNLDGAFGEASPENPHQGAKRNRQALQAILTAAQETGAQVQFGGGLRSLVAVEDALQLGVTRVVLGTAVIEQPELLPTVLSRWGAERVAAGLDARGGLIQVRGWQTGTAIPAVDLAQRLSEQGLHCLVFTDIARDGLQTGLNLAATVELAQRTGLNVIASGGVSGWEDIRAASSAGLAGVIVGRALYEGKFEPQELFQTPC